MVAAAVSASGPTVNQQIRVANAPDLILYNGVISTLDGSNSTVKAIAIRDGKIIATDDQNGRIKALADKGTTVVDLKGRRVLPGLIDGHLHGMREGYHCWTQVVRLDLVTSRSTALAMYAAKAVELPDGKWIWTTQGGWSLAQLDNPTLFTFAELSAAAPANPLWIQGGGFAGARVNQAALTALGLGPGSPGVVLDASGNPTGQLVAPARRPRTRPSSPSSTRSASTARRSASRTSSARRTAAASRPGRTPAATTPPGAPAERSTTSSTSKRARCSSTATAASTPASPSTR